ncbi:lymphatic vessel endothelial hyaluronic acid receptor 1 [Pseudophryne corroboree]|uniref:lymphatic vessel endothelial hyaluronic acid receptor 1 n=1 Tax=Pseudophryne corroboree TaxID=495146 RepID=UPI003081BA9D
MLCRCGCLCLVLSLFLIPYLAYSSVDVRAIVPLKCRIAGVVLVENEDRTKKFNYTMAESVCQLLGLELASKAQLEKAWRYGFETCSYGWVTDKFGVISRIQRNEKCGRNQTGVLTWSIPLSGYFNAYCFNVSDTQINSCKPELMVTRPPSTVVPLSESTTVPIRHNSETEAQTLQAIPKTQRDLLTTLKDSSTRALPATTQTSLRTTQQPATQSQAPTAELPSTLENQVSPKQLLHKSERVIFGGLPTTLLILALLFFIAAVVLAICYIKKYKTNLLFTKKKEEKEAVETKVFKEMVHNNREEEENTQNGKQAASTGNSIEAEV